MSINNDKKNNEQKNTEETNNIAEKSLNSKYANDNFNDQKIQILENLNLIKNNSIKKINKQISNANKKLENEVDAYNRKIDFSKKLSDLYGEKVKDVLYDEYKKNIEQWNIGDEQINLTSKQEIAQQKGQANNQILKYLGKIINEFRQKESQGAENPLLSSNYLQRVAEFMKNYFQKRNERKKNEIKKEQSELKKKADSFKKKQKKLLLKKQKKSKKYSNLKQQNAGAMQKYEAKINNIYNGEFEKINKKYKKILGLEEKYRDKIDAANEIKEKEELVNQFKTDTDRILKASFNEIKEEDNKFNKKGDRVETKLEKKEKKKREKEKKKIIIENQNDKNNIDEGIKEAFSDLNKDNTQNKEDKIHINDISNSDNIVNNNLNINSYKNNQPSVSR